MTEKISEKALVVERMDKAIRCLNDEENPAIQTWLSEGVPDGASLEEIDEFIKEDPNWYSEMCTLFAELISDVIVNGDINSKGFLIEFWRDE